MFKLKLVTILFFWTYSIFVYASGDMGFDEICRVYTEAQNSSMKKEQLGNYIFDNVKKRVNVKDALQAHEAVFLADPNERYSLFKQSAELSLKRSWDCAAVEALMK